ncbi:MAG: amino acid permease [Sandaracinaceae bacterium]|nr:amino acid permease [Sandaracinaceae bacterium]
MRGLFTRKPIAELRDDEDPSPHALKRSLGAWDLIFLAIGAVIGAGIFSSIGTAIAGEVTPAGEVVRYGAGPAVVVSFLLLGVVCGLAALCYAELASMIPHAGSAYAYAYATLGELIAWIIGWDLVLEYAVGNVAVAIAWAGYLDSLLSGIGIHIPPWLVHGYFDVAASSDPTVHGLLTSAPHLAGVPILINLPAFLVVAAVTGLLVFGAKESARANAVMVGIKLLVLGLFVVVGATHVDPAHYTPFAPNGWTGIHQGAAIVFFAYIGFDAISTAAEETRNPQRNMPIGILGGLAICTVIYVIVGIVMTGLAPWESMRVPDPLAHALETAGLPVVQWLVSAGAVVSITAVLLVFQYGQPRILLGMARDGLLPKRLAGVHPRFKTPWTLTILTGILVGVGALFADDDATYDLTNIGTLFAFLLVCVGVMVLRVVDPSRVRPFRVPFVWVIAPLGAAACVWTMAGLPTSAWIRFAVWLAIGIVLYFAYGYRHSVLRRRAASDQAPT